MILQEDFHVSPLIGRRKRNLINKQLSTQLPPICCNQLSDVKSMSQSRMLFLFTRSRLPDFDSQKWWEEKESPHLIIENNLIRIYFSISKSKVKSLIVDINIELSGILIAGLAPPSSKFVIVRNFCFLFKYIYIT